ncbi:AGAP005998-PA-like protein [Anopheles sinensis]|uniref:AGAP005998-PA-like protein n=1 Tax=Anopheles sinensis TaxID=74873 RepID=A0A084W0U1_ANOSI|nr:AGAP005998-PA-like protein [Anopheles sinensis]
MKFVIVFAAIMVVGLTAPAPQNDNQGEAGYNNQFGESTQNFGDVLPASHGSYTYTGPDGQVYTVNFVANENGFQPAEPYRHLP